MTASASIKGIVFNIQKYSVHDGPGIRTIAFLKGCPLACRWCSNPESQKSAPELAYNKSKCLNIDQCGRCVEVCTAGAITVDDDRTIRIDRNLCVDCMQCADACPSQALIVYGKPMSVDEVLRVVEQDAMFYSRSGGGMTLSGGEPIFQAEFALALLREARTRRIGTAMESAGYCRYEDLSAACALLDHLLFDVKSLNPERHREMTGRPVDLIQDNLRRLRVDFPRLPMTIRTPVIPGFNDSEEDIREIADLAARLGAGYEILPYHRLAQPKYTYIGRTYSMPKVSLDETLLGRLREISREATAAP
ncbi:glycyl-radical enzyme activating protein [Desulfovibrio aminophilus]|uniref:(2S)-3-sulfopropanediol dehydratase activating enzyme n=1 Tax=Desulfovibrio aminophilus TaxID=81425 RepID=UPI0033949AD1